MNLGGVDWLIIALYFAFVVGIGVVLTRTTRSGKDFFLAGRSVPAWVAGLAFISANLGAQEVIGMGASGAKYGISTAHFYWIGAIPAMVFIGIFMMPFYYGSKARSVPEYLRLRFDEKTRALNAITFAAMTVLSSGISMYAMAKLLQTLHVFDAAFGALHLPPDAVFHAAIGVSAAIVLAYILLGGLKSAIYNEVLQFFLIVAGLFPLVYLGLKSIGGWNGLRAALPAAYTHAWYHANDPHANLLGVDVFGLVMGLGFVLSFGYWCTDFLVVQRALAADSMGSARRAPLLASVPKMLFPFIVILPGVIAIAITSAHGSLIPAKLGANGSPLLDPSGKPVLDFDLAIPSMMLHFFPPGILGLGLTALLASFMSGMAGNVTAFNTVFTYDIYQSYVRPDADDAHYVFVGRVVTVVGIAVSIAAAYAVAQFNDIMDALQLVFAFVNAPLFATFLLGMFWKRTTGHGAFAGLLAGSLAAALHHGLTLPADAVAGVKGGWFGVLHVYPSEMSQNFYTAIFAWCTCFAVTIVVSMLTRPRPQSELHGLVYSLTPRERDGSAAWYARPAFIGIAVLAGCAILNVVFR